MSHDTHHAPTTLSAGDETERGGDVLNLSSGLEALEAGAEFQGPVEPIDDHPHCNEHLALIHETGEEQFAATVPYVRQGIERGERVLYVLSENSRATVAAAMRAGGIDVDAAVDSGQLSFHTVEETYLREGSFSPDEMLAFYEDAIDEATEEWAALRVAAETGWVADETTDLESWLEYEARVNDVFEGADSIALCQYDRTLIPPEIIRDLVHTHPHLVYDNTVCHNFYYTPPEEFTGPDQPDREVDRMLKTLRERTVAKTDLREQQEFLRRQNEITAHPDLSFEEKLQALFELGCERFDLELGAMARVDPGADHLRVEHVSSAHGDLEPGVELPLSETYCAAAADIEAAASISDPRACGYDDRVVHDELGLRAYIGTYVEVDGADDRTFFFVTSERREGPFTPEDHTVVQMMGQWVRQELEQRSREDRLTALNGLNRSLMGAETVEEVADCVADAASGLGLPATLVARYDGGVLREAASTDPADRGLDPKALLAVGDGVGWKAFATGAIQRADVPADGMAAGAGPNLRHRTAVPLDDYGVLVTAATAGRGVSDADVEFLETVAANTTTALDRVRQQQQLEKRERTLEERNASLVRLDRINTIIREIDKALVEAGSRREIESVVCERLTEAGPFESAWIGRCDPVTGEVTPTEHAGAGSGHGGPVDAVVADSFVAGTGDAVDAGDADTAPSLAVEAGRTREVQVVDDLLTDGAADSWREAALDRGYHSVVALPLAYGDTVFGVLTVYADRPGVFDDLERSVLEELGDNIGHAINNVESKRSLVDGTVTELEFAFGDDVDVAGFADDLGCAVVHEGLVSGSDGELRWFFGTRGATTADVARFAPQLQATDVELVAEREVDGEPVCLFEASLSCGSLPAAVLEHGGRVRELRAEGGTATATIDVGSGMDLREFVGMVRTKYRDAELVGKRTRSRPLRTADDCRSTMTEALTDRQREVLETAYYSGYFQEPRTRTGGDIAASLGVSQPTFATHLRTAERKLCDELFGGPSP